VTRRGRSAVPLTLVGVLLAASTATAALSAPRASDPTTTSSSALLAATTTTTTIPRERAQAGWAVAEDSARGVMVDTRRVTVGSATFRVVRLRRRSTLLRWHVGLGEPYRWQSAPADAGPRIDWAHEGAAGVVAVFNGGFKQAANAGGAMADGVVMMPPVRGRATVAIDAGGQWAMGTWGANFPPAGFAVVSYRQNLVPLVVGGAPTAAAAAGGAAVWGSPLGNRPAQARTGLGVDARGNLLFAATMTPVLPVDLARALVAAGARYAMELDINPYWPILGVPLHPLHRPGGPYAIQLPGAMHPATIYDTGWTRDFFVALAEPGPWGCSWRGPGLGPGGAARAQPLRKVGAGCVASVSRPPPSTTPTSPTTTSPAGP
jgi:hypothetical protein